MCDWMIGNIHEECGVFGIYCSTKRNVALSVYHALYALQHRGQESAGIVVNDRGAFTYHKDLGLVHEVFSRERLEGLGEGQIAIGHVRYAASSIVNRSGAQPLVASHVKGRMAIAHNGSLTNAKELRQEYEYKGGIFHTANDAEVISYAITEQRLVKPSIEEAMVAAMSKLQGAYSLVVMSPKKLLACRDPHGFRPLCLGKTRDGDYVVASETCAFDSIGAAFIRDVRPGELIVITEEGLKSITDHCGSKSRMCVFEYVYFARPDSVIEGVSVHKARQRAGAGLWKEHPVEADVVFGVPDSGLDAALGLALASGIPYGVGFNKNRYVGRTFIQPTQGMREDAVRIKLNTIRETIEGKRVILVDDSIVRGTTARHIVQLVREAGAKEVHLRISCPPFVSPCYFGTDIDSKDKLIACRMSTEEIAEQMCVDSLGFLSIDGIRAIAAEADAEFCEGCFTGNYPAPVPETDQKNKFYQQLNND